MNPVKYSTEYLVAVIVSVFVLSASFHYVEAELTPPYFNLAEGRQISATATCGVGTDGPELYCKLVGANTEHDNMQHKYELIQGQVRKHIHCFLFFLFFKSVKAEKNGKSSLIDYWDSLIYFGKHIYHQFHLNKN